MREGTKVIMATNDSVETIATRHGVATATAEALRSTSVEDEGRTTVLSAGPFVRVQVNNAQLSLGSAGTISGSVFFDQSQRNGFASPFKLRPGNALDILSHPRWAWDVGIKGKPHSLGNFALEQPSAYKEDVHLDDIPKDKEQLDHKP